MKHIVTILMIALFANFSQAQNKDYNDLWKKVDKLKTVMDSWESEPVSHDLLKNNSLTRFDQPNEKKKRQPNRQVRKNKRRFNDKKNK